MDNWHWDIPEELGVDGCKSIAKEISLLGNSLLFEAKKKDNKDKCR